MTTVHNDVIAEVGKYKKSKLIRGEDEVYGNGYTNMIKHIKVDYKKNSLIIIETR